MRKLGQKKNKGQSSIEYLLILTAFFASLGIILPIIESSTNSFLLISDTILAKNISEELNEQCNLFNYSGNGSSKEFIKLPSKMIKIKSDTKMITILPSNDNGKEYVVYCKNNSVFEKNFESKFSITISKENDSIMIDAHEI